MPRSARILIDGGTYHVLTRGNNGQMVFHQDADYQRYLQLLSTSAKAHRLQIYHFSLMPHHVHLVLEAAQGGALSHAMQGLNLTYALFYRRHYDYRGHLWQGRFKSLLIDRDRYLLECGRYVELHPIRAGLVTELREYIWSSYRVYAEGADNPMMAPHPLYDALGATMRERQREYREFMQRGVTQAPAAPLERSRVIGGTTASRSTLGELFRVPGIRRRRGRPRTREAAAWDGETNSGSTPLTTIPSTRGASRNSAVPHSSAAPYARGQPDACLDPHAHDVALATTACRRQEPHRPLHERPDEPQTAPMP